MKANVPAQEKSEVLNQELGNTIKAQYGQNGDYLGNKKFIFTIKELPQTETVTNENGYLSPGDQPYAMLDSEASLPLMPLDVESVNFDKKHAYLYNGYIYLFRGPRSRALAFEPGIYYDPDNDNYFIRECETGNPEYDKYRATPDHIIKGLNPLSIKQMLKDNEEEIYAKQRLTSHRFLVPSVTARDDILKRLSKKFLLAKNVDLDQCRINFVDKNSLFNYKQVLKSMNRLSMMLFQRGTDALHLRFYIVVEEVDPAHPVGDALQKPIIVCSDDTYANAPGDTEDRMNTIISNYRDNSNVIPADEEEDIAA